MTATLSAQSLAVVVLGAALAAVSPWLGESAQYFIAHAMVLAVFAVGFDLVYGVGGMMSLGHAAFFGSGSYVFAWLTMKAQWSTAPAMLAAILFSGLLAAVFGALVLRSAGVQLALTTLALAQLVLIVVEVKLKSHTGGTDGLPGVPRPDWFGIDFTNPTAFYLLVCAIFTLALLGIALLRHSPFGRVLAGSRQNAVRMSQLGYDINAYRLTAFVLSGMYAGLAGALMASLTLFVGPDSLRWTVSGDILIMTILGGAGTLFGPVLGVLVYEFIKEFGSRFTEHWYGLLGLFFIAITLFMPGGLVRARWPGRRRAAVVKPEDTVVPVKEVA